MVKIAHIEEPSIRYRTVKYFLSLFCFLYLCQGFVTLTVLIWLAVQRLSVCDFSGRYFTANYLLLAASVVCTLTGLVGLVHVVCARNERNLRFLVVVVCSILFLECASAVISHVHLTEIYDGSLLSEMKLIFSSKEASATDCTSAIQAKFHCCGVNNYTDYLTTNSTEYLFPSHCLCTSGNDCFVYNSLQRNLSIHESGCYTKMYNKLESHLVVYRIIGPVVGALQLVLFILTVYIVTKIHSSSVIGAYVVGFEKHQRPNQSCAHEPADDSTSSHM